jgi:hypothetical protein
MLEVPARQNDPPGSKEQLRRYESARQIHDLIDRVDAFCSAGSTPCRKNSGLQLLLRAQLFSQHSFTPQKPG